MLSINEHFHLKHSRVVCPSLKKRNIIFLKHYTLYVLAFCMKGIINAFFNSFFLRKNVLFL